METRETHPVLPNCPSDPSLLDGREAASEPAPVSRESTKPRSTAEGGDAAPRGPTRSGGTPASPIDEALASIDARLKALQGASSRVELQLENQQMNFALMMDAFNQLQNKAIVHEIGSAPQAPKLAQAPQWKAVKLRTRSKEGAANNGQDLLSIISPAVLSLDIERNDRASSKDSAWTRSGNRLKTAPSFSPQDSRSASRNNTAPTPHHVQDLTDDATPAHPGSPKGVAKVNAIPESAQEPSELRATSLSERGGARGCPSGGVDGSRSNLLRMPIVGRRKHVPEASQDAHQESEADTHGVCKMASNKSNLSSRSSGARGRSGAEHVQEAEMEIASYPSGFWDDMQQNPNHGWHISPSTGTDMSKVNHLLEGRAEDVARAASLGTGGTLLDDEVDLPPFMLPPSSWVHIVLAILMAAAVVYTGLLSPMALAYFRDGLSSSWAIPMYIADSLWLVYIMVVFRTAFYDPRGVMVVGAREIAANYARKWLLLDLLCAWPAFLAAPAGTAAYSTCMVLKLLRTPRLAPLISFLQKEYRVHALAPLKWGLIVLLLSHSLACFWRLLQCDVESRIGAVIPDLYCEGNDWWHRYVSDMYWMTMTLSTVGYGDIPAYNTWARVFNIFVMFLSPVFFGSVVATLSNVMDRLFDEKVENCVSDMSRFMRRHSVPKGLQLRVERSLRQVLNNEVNITPLDPELFARLSPALQRTFSFAILSGTIGRFPLFRGAIHSFVAELAQAHMLVHCSAGDLVGEAGQLVEDLVFIVNGELVARFSADWPDTLDVPTDDLVHAGSDEPVPRRPSNDRRTSVDLTQGIGGQRILRKGAWFGEASVMGRRHVRTASIIAQQPTELAVLNKEEYNRVMNKYPSMAKRHDRLVQEMGNSTVCLADISWSETPSAFQHSATWARRRSMEWLSQPP